MAYAYLLMELGSSQKEAAKETAALVASGAVRQLMEQGFSQKKAEELLKSQPGDVFKYFPNGIYDYVYGNLLRGRYKKRARPLKTAP
jgi:hypothetical protein